MHDSNPKDIVDYWLGDSAESPKKALARHKIWYRGGTIVDEEIREKFLPRVIQARAGSLGSWESSPEGALALIILLDQFTRNLFRGTPEAYAGDKLAHEIAERAVIAGLDKTLSVPGRIFLYHPFHHCEEAIGQNRGVELLETLAKEVPRKWRAHVQRSIKGFGGHRDVVVQFGRFPHRNNVLGRQNTALELTYLESEPETYGQTKT